MRRGEPATAAASRGAASYFLLAALHDTMLVHRIPCTACAMRRRRVLLRAGAIGTIAHANALGSLGILPGFLLLYQYFVCAAALLISAGGLTNNSSNTVLEQDYACTVCAVLASPSWIAARAPRERARER